MADGEPPSSPKLSAAKDEMKVRFLPGFADRGCFSVRDSFSPDLASMVDPPEQRDEFVRRFTAWRPKRYARVSAPARPCSGGRGSKRERALLHAPLAYGEATDPHTSAFTSYSPSHTCHLTFDTCLFFHHRRIFLEVSVSDFFPPTA